MSHPFDALTPDLILDALDAFGWLTDGRQLALNSYENRVVQVGQEEGTPVTVGATSKYWKNMHSPLSWRTRSCRW